MAAGTLASQMITGVWKGRINRQKAELKIVQKGDSLTGTSYYSEGPGRYRRYSIKGYFDAGTNEAVWWDDQLIAEKPARSGPGAAGLLSRADFNCPGGSRMMLNGKTGTRPEKQTGDLHLEKEGETEYADEWDFIIDNYTAGANDPWLIDSVEMIAGHPVHAEQPVVTAPPPVTRQPVVRTEPPARNPEKPEPVILAEKPVTPPGIEEKFKQRRQVLVTDIPIRGDSIELRFYDNAEIDGDSISLFLNNKLIFQHIRLLGSAYSFKLALSDLQDINELTMVAENLGSIPPNTSYMVVLVGDERYDARLESTEGSSAMVRLSKKR